MNKLSTLVFIFALLLCIGSVYSIDHSLGSDLEIKPSVIDKMKKEKFTYSYKELKNKKKDYSKKCETLKGKIIYSLNYIAKKGEQFKRFTEKSIDNISKRKLIVYGLVFCFVLWYLRRVVKNNMVNKKNVNIYFKQSENFGKSSYQDISYPYYENNSYLSDKKYQYSHSYNSENCRELPYHTSCNNKSKTSRFFSQRKRKNSNEENNNLFNYAYV